MKTDPKVGQRIPELDGLRGMAILLVVFYHYVYGRFRSGDNSLLARFIHAFFPLSWSGVDLFFVLSGFLIGGILMDCRKTENYFSAFYIRRFCRIIPLYFLWLILFFLLVHIFTLHPPSEWCSAIFLSEIPHFARWKYFIFLQNFYTAKTSLFGPTWLAATWSLAVEEQFYLLLPFIIWCIPPRKLLVVLVSLVLLVPVFRVCIYLFQPQLFMYVLLPCRADALLSGVLCACLVRNDRIRSWLEKEQKRLYLAFSILALGIGCLTVFSHGQDYNKLFTSFEMITFGYSMLAMFYACLLLMVITSKTGLINGLMGCSLLRHFGLIAYGVFLMHMSINSLVNGMIFGQEPGYLDNLSDGLPTLLAFLATWLLAVLSWRFIERPIINWGHTFSYSREVILPKPNKSISN